MGKILPQYKKTVIDNIINSVTSGESNYYAFAANPVPNSGDTPAIVTDDYDMIFLNEWQMMFGKKLANTNFAPVAKNIPWTSGTVYTRYDSKDANLYSSNYYVVTAPMDSGGDYTVFKCIDNANGAPSTVIPDQIQAASFTKSDGYTWRYITSISSADYSRFASDQFIPVFPNTSIVSGARSYAGVEVVDVVNGGSGYNAYNDGTVRGIVNTTVIQIDSTASSDNDFYTQNGIYIYNTTSSTAQLKTVVKYVSNLSGNWVYLDSPANTDNITPSITQYKISPAVVFRSDGDVIPSAYSIINPFSNSIANVVIVDTGVNISWANVSIVSNSVYGSGASLYAVAPPSNGHGYDPISELNVQGLGIYWVFANTENNTIPTVATFNKIGLLNNPNALAVNAESFSIVTPGAPWTANTFNALLTANVSPEVTFNVGDQVTSNTQGALGTVAFSNSTTIYLTGDKYFLEGDLITSSDGTTSATISNVHQGDIYTNEIVPLYIQNITDVNRANNNTELFKLVIQV